MITNGKAFDFRRKLATGLAALTAIAVPLAGCSEPDATEPVTEVVSAYDGDWITLAGQVVSATPSAFVLDYGKGLITVEMDDWDFYGEGGALMAGDGVIVTGRADENLFVADTIEASSVYVESLDTTYYANPIDEEAFSTIAAPTVTIEPGVTYTGWVTDVSQEAFMLGSGASMITVDVSQLETNPLESDRIEVGDRVTVSGEFDFDAEGQTRVVADNVIELTIDKGANSGPGDNGDQSSS